jgi:hypothetical protein
MMVRHVSTASRASVMEASGVSMTLDAILHRLKASDVVMTLGAILRCLEEPSLGRPELWFR